MKSDNLDIKLNNIKKKLAAAMSSKVAFAPTGSMPPPDPAMMGGGAPMDPAMAGGAPPMDPAMMGGGAPMDPAMMGGDPAAMGGAPMDPAMAGGMPPMDPAAMGAPPVDPSAMGAMPPQEADPMQMLTDLNDKVDALGKVLTKICRKFDISLEGDDNGAESLLNSEDAAAVEDVQDEQAQQADPLSGEAAEAVEDPQEQNYVQQQLAALGGGM